MRLAHLEVLNKLSWVDIRLLRRCQNDSIWWYLHPVRTENGSTQLSSRSLLKELSTSRQRHKRLLWWWYGFPIGPRDSRILHGTWATKLKIFEIISNWHPKDATLIDSIIQFSFTLVELINHDLFKGRFWAQAVKAYAQECSELEGRWWYLGGTLRVPWQRKETSIFSVCQYW